MIRPWDPARSPASVDCASATRSASSTTTARPAIDLREPPANLTEEVWSAPDEPVRHPPRRVRPRRTLEWVELPDDIVARIEGKALALDTPIPTPTGWKLMDQLRDRRSGLRRARPPDRGHRRDRGDDRPRVPRGLLLGRHEPRVRPRPPVGGADQVRPQVRQGPRADHARDGGSPPGRPARVRLPCRAGRTRPLLTEAPAHRPVRARRVARRRHQCQGRSHVRRRADPARARARRLRGQARHRPRSPTASAVRATRETSAPGDTRATTLSTAGCATSGCSATSTSRRRTCRARSRSGAPSWKG